VCWITVWNRELQTGLIKELLATKLTTKTFQYFISKAWGTNFWQSRRDGEKQRVKLAAKRHMLFYHRI
jgi:hypothetical protein